MAKRYTSYHYNKVIAFGGGHGLAANLRALRLITQELTAVVTVADNGGSSGRLRESMPILPPGDLRMALSALCEDSEWGNTWSNVLQHRFDHAGDLDGHALGNLLFVALWQQLEDPIEALKWVGKLLGVTGTVLPMALEPLDIEAIVEFYKGNQPVEEIIRGQAEVAATAGRVKEVKLIPAEPEVPSQVFAAIEAADWLIIGPGSWYTSVLPHLFIPKLRDAIANSPAKRCITMNLEAGNFETQGLSSTDLLDAVFKAAPEIHFDAIIADPNSMDDRGEELKKAAAKLGIELLLRPVSVYGKPSVHDPLRLAAAYRDIFDSLNTK